MSIEDYRTQPKEQFQAWLRQLVLIEPDEVKSVCIVCDGDNKGGVESFLSEFATKKHNKYWYRNVEFSVFEVSNIKSFAGMKFQRVILFNHPNISYNTFSKLKLRLRGHEVGDALFADLDVSDRLFGFWQY